MQLKIIVVGAGLSGLSAAIACAIGGHKVTVLEAKEALAEVGAGIQITPNASRLFQRWGLPPQVWESAAEPSVLTVHRFSGEILAYEPVFKQKIRSRYGAPFIDMHRADLQRALFDRAIELGVTVHMDVRMERIDSNGPAVLTAAGRRFRGDLIVGADGLWSKCRQELLGSKDEPSPTGDLAYRIVLSVDDVVEEDLRFWIQNPSCHFWIGPGAHAVAYSLKGGRMLNMVLLVPDNLPAGVSKQAGSVDEMRELFTGWDPILTRFLSKVNQVDKWKLMHRSELPSWVNDSSTLVLIGDSCHPMLPYLGQGANSSIEDGAVLGAILTGIQNKSQLPRALALYEQLRKARGEAIARETFAQRHDFHLPDGPEQQRRDDLFRSQLGLEIEVKFPSRWTCPQTQPWLYGYNAYQEVEDALKDNCFGGDTQNLSMAKS